MPVFSIDQAKLSLYLLNPAHPKGGPKSTLFVRYGFSRDRPAELADALVVHAEQFRSTSIIMIDRYATKRAVEGPLSTPSGRTSNAVSVWELMPNDRERFITAYIREI